MKHTIELTEDQQLSLVDCIYNSLISNPENGMGEMGDCKDEAERIVNEWVQKENIRTIDLTNTVKEGNNYTSTKQLMRDMESKINELREQRMKLRVSLEFIREQINHEDIAAIRDKAIFSEFDSLLKDIDYEITHVLNNTK